MLRSRVSLLIVFALLFMGVPSLIQFYTDWLWFGEVGYQHVFARMLTAKWTIVAVMFGVAFAAIAGNLLLAFRTLTRRELMIVTPDGPRVVVVDPGRMRPLVLAGAGLGSFALALYAGSEWTTWLMFWNAVPFNQQDAILGRDIGYYLFSLPVYELLRRLAMLILVPTLIGVVLLYVSAGRVGYTPSRGFYMNAPAQTHVSILLAIGFLLLAIGAWLSVPALLTSPSGIIHGASYVDVHARIPVLRLLAVAAGLGVLLAAYQAMQQRLWPLGLAIGLYLATAIGGSAYAAAIQRFVVAPNEQVKETPYIVNNVAATLKAFALDKVEKRELSGDALLDRAAINRNQVTLKNVPLWDHQPLLDTFGQIQEIRTYYDFVSVDNDRYTINGEYRQIMLSARELNSNSLPNATWINEHLTFTHGYGLTLGPVNQVTSEGLPVLFIKNLPPESSVDLKLTEPSLYFGELSNDHVFVKTRTKEFHYPKGNDNVFATYEGRGGVSVGSFFHKLLFAMRFRSLKTLLTNDLTAESRVLFNRRVSERVRMIAPFLEYDQDPYLAIEDERLFWVQDAYTISDRYPYATPAGERVNYIRNSVKVVIDAYHGTTTFYIVDPNDPIAQTLARSFPGLFKPLAEMPAGLRQRLRYPQTIFALQAAMYSTYHMENPAVFYNKEDQWEIPSIGSGNQPQRMEPYYTIMRLPGEPREEFIQMLPFTPRQKDNLAAWMVARSDGDSYGRLTVFQFPKQKVIFGPRQVTSRINQDQTIAPQITLWNQQGSEVIQGTLLVIPIEESLIYIRPLYLRASGGRIPELKRVIVAYQNHIVMAETLEAAIDQIFPATSRRDGPTGAQPPVETTTGQSSPATPVTGIPADLLAQARLHYERALKAQREGNWALYGEEIKQLGDVLNRVNRADTAPAAPPKE